MHRTGSDPASMGPEDFICDFTGRTWDGSFPMVEGHRGSLICGDALAVAYADVVLGGRSTMPPGSACTMCLEERDEPGWQSPTPVQGEAARICRRCIKQSATRLEKDPDWSWRRPQAAAADTER